MGERLDLRNTDTTIELFQAAPDYLARPRLRGSTSPNRSIECPLVSRSFVVGKRQALEGMGFGNSIAASPAIVMIEIPRFQMIAYSSTLQRVPCMTMRTLRRGTVIRGNGLTTTTMMYSTNLSTESNQAHSNQGNPGNVLFQLSLSQICKINVRFRSPLQSLH